MAPEPEAGVVTRAKSFGVSGELPTFVVVLVGAHVIVCAEGATPEEEETKTIESVGDQLACAVTRLSSSKPPPSTTILSALIPPERNRLRYPKASAGAADLFLGLPK
jgi:hypothetical protein